MTEGKHTPGPWRAKVWRHSGGADTVCIYDSKGRELIGWPGFDGLDGFTKVEIRANAHLAAAAPQMLEALHEARSQIAYLHDKLGSETGTGNAVLAKIDAAISLASPSVERNTSGENNHD